MARKQHLLNGRRVQLVDLMRADLINEGDALIYKRPKYGLEHLGVVDRRGHLVVDGVPFKTVSGAASALSGTQVDGWEAWFVENSGESIAALRAKLLAKNVRSDAGDSEATTGVVDRHAFLKSALASAHEGNPVQLQTTWLVQIWGNARLDSDLIDEINADLANYGLRAQPSLDPVEPASAVTLHLIEAETEESPAGAENENENENENVRAIRTTRDDRVRAATAVRRLLVGGLSSASGGVRGIPPQASIDQAITLMALNDYSQLAVMVGVRGQPLAISWRSVARARNVDPNCTLAAATFEPRVFRTDDDLIEALPVLDEQDFFLVRGPANDITGIVTASDVVGAYRDLASPFLLIGEIDQTLRRIVEVTFDAQTIIEACDPDGSRGVSSATQLSIGDYLQIMQNDARWGALDWRLDRGLFCARLDEVRRIRNAVMHFSGESLAPSAISMLRNFLSLLREYSTE